MSLLFAMLPIYVLGNLHCLGMCGPVAMLLGASPYRGFYLLGRLISFTLAGTIAGLFGEVIGVWFATGWFSVVFGTAMVAVGLSVVFGMDLPYSHSLAKKFAPLHGYLNHLLLIQEPWPLFLVGFLTIFLPCGQTLIVYSACALSGSAFVGTINGLAFGLLTTPSLLLAMQAKRWIKGVKGLYHPLVGGLAVVIGVITILRGFAEWEVIPHVGVHPFMIF